jgi:hypothetical protein
MIRINFDVDIIFSLKAQGSYSSFPPLPASIVWAPFGATFQRHFNVLIKLLKYLFSPKQLIMLISITNVRSRQSDLHVLCQFKAATISLKNAVNQTLPPLIVAE